MRGPERSNGRPGSGDRGLRLPARERDLGERCVGFRSPRRVAGEDAHELLRVLRRSFGQREQLLVGAVGAEQRCLQGEPGQRLAACRGASLLRREPNGALEMLAHPLGVSRHGARHATRGIELAGAKGSRVDGRCLRGAVEPRLRLLDLPQLEMRQRETRGRGELERPVAQQACVSVSFLAPREREVGDDLRAGEDLDAVEHLRLDRGALALARERGHLRSQAPDLLDPLRSPEQMDVDAEADVRPGDDRGHHAPPVADLLEQLDGALVPPHALLELRGDRRVGQDLVRRLAGREARHDRHDLAALDLLHVPLAHPGDGGDPELAKRGSLGGDVAQLLGELARPPEGFGSGIEVDLPRCAERLAEGHSQQVLPQLQARRQLGRAVATRVGDLAHRPRQLGGLILVLGHAQRGSAAQLDVELEVRVTESLRERRQLG